MNQRTEEAVMKHTKKLEDACKRRPVTNKWYQQYLSIVDDFSHADGQSAIDLMSLSSIVDMNGQVEKELKEQIQTMTQVVYHLVDDQLNGNVINYDKLEELENQ